MPYKHNYFIDLIFGIIIAAIAIFAVSGSYRAAQEENVFEETETQAETAIAESEPESAKAQEETQETEAKNYPMYKPTVHLNVRQEPDQNSPVVTVIPLGTPVPVINSEGSWWLVEYNGVQGYAWPDYLQPADQ